MIRLNLWKPPEASGLPAGQARAISAAVQQSYPAIDVATKKDIEDLRKDMEMVRKDLIIKMGGILVVAVGVLAVMIKLPL